MADYPNAADCQHAKVADHCEHCRWVECDTCRARWHADTGLGLDRDGNRITVQV